MKQPVNPLQYDFNKSYYQNFYDNRLQGIKTFGKYKNDFVAFYNEETFIANGNTVSSTIDITQHIQRQYDNSTAKCLEDKFKQEWSNFWGGLGF